LLTLYGLFVVLSTVFGVLFVHALISKSGCPFLPLACKIPLVTTNMQYNMSTHPQDVWRDATAVNDFQISVERLDDGVFLARSDGRIDSDALAVRERLLGQLLQPRSPDAPTYLVEDLSGITSVSLPSGGDFAGWFSQELDRLTMIVACGVSRATRPLVRVGRLFAPESVRLETADDYAAALDLIRQHQAGTLPDTCPVSGLPIYRDEDWRYDNPAGEFSFTLERLGDAFFLGRSVGAPTAEDLQARLALIQRLFENLPSDQPLYLLEDFSQVEKMPRHLNRSQSLWFPETAVNLALVIPFALNRSVRALARVGQLLADTAVTVKFAADYSEAMSLALQHRSGQMSGETSNGLLPLSQVRALVAQIQASAQTAASAQAAISQSKEIAVGSVVGRYQIKDILGRGGMAVVFLAYDIAFRREVALKALSMKALSMNALPLTDDVAFPARFEQEGRIIALLEHNAIVPVYDLGDYGGQPYLVMRYMTGGVLRSRLEEKALPLTAVRQIVNRLASALDYAHSRGIIHRDLKPANIFFDQFGEAYLADFGIARMQNEESPSLIDSSVGTPAYMSPEQIAGQEAIDHRSDIYSLGVLLFEMLTGRLPFAHKSPVDVAMRHLTAPPPIMQAINPDLPAECQPIIERAMAKAPGDRYDFAGQLAEDLAAIPH
jgi:tRNA A-37 threonylcarbamoyl transferase component Bud32